MTAHAHASGPAWAEIIDADFGGTDTRGDRIGSDGAAIWLGLLMGGAAWHAIFAICGVIG